MDDVRLSIGSYPEYEKFDYVY